MILLCWWFFDWILAVVRRETAFVWTLKYDVSRALYPLAIYNFN